MTVPSGRLPKALADLRDRAALDEVVVLSTCMRTEVYATADRFHPAVQDIRNFLCESSFSAPEDVADHLTFDLVRAIAGDAGDRERENAHRACDRLAQVRD